MIAHHLFGKVSWDLKGNGQYPPYLDHKGVAEGFKIFSFLSRQVRVVQLQQNYK